MVLKKHEFTPESVTVDTYVIISLVLLFIVLIRIPLSIEQLAIMVTDCCSTDTL